MLKWCSTKLNKIYKREKRKKEKKEKERKRCALTDSANTLSAKADYKHLYKVNHAAI